VDNDAAEVHQHPYVGTQSFAAYRRLSKFVTVYRLFGVPVLRVETLDRRTRVKLFCAFTVLTVKRSHKPVATV